MTYTNHEPAAISKEVANDWVMGRNRAKRTRMSSDELKNRMLRTGALNLISEKHGDYPVVLMPQSLDSLAIQADVARSSTFKQFPSNEDYDDALRLHIAEKEDLYSIENVTRTKEGVIDLVQADEVTPSGGFTIFGNRLLEEIDYSMIQRLQSDLYTLTTIRKNAILQQATEVMDAQYGAYHEQLVGFADGVLPKGLSDRNPEVTATDLHTVAVGSALTGAAVNGTLFARLAY